MLPALVPTNIALEFKGEFVNKIFLFALSKLIKSYNVLSKPVKLHASTDPDIKVFVMSTRDILSIEQVNPFVFAGESYRDNYC